MKLDEKLVSLRKEKGITQLKVAEELDISRQAISRWESGVAMPSTENLRRLSELYSVPLDYLINEDSKSSAQIDISVSVDVFTGDITTTFSIAPSASGTVTPYGKKQILFYNDGTKYVEA